MQRRTHICLCVYTHTWDAHLFTHSYIYACVSFDTTHTHISTRTHSQELAHPHTHIDMYITNMIVNIQTPTLESSIFCWMCSTYEIPFGRGMFVDGCVEREIYFLLQNEYKNNAYNSIYFIVGVNLIEKIRKKEMRYKMNAEESTMT